MHTDKPDEDAGHPRGGEKYPLDDEAILRIRSPREFLGGPHVVLYVAGDPERWALVAIDWKVNGVMVPRLGMRWFHGRLGNPQSSGFSTWLVVPCLLERGILLSLPNSVPWWRVKLVQEFLGRGLTGSELKAAWSGPHG